jgi:bifunctional non-homologous end joining protein LigD
MPLEEYSAKRNFAKTSEPAPQQGQAHRRPIFVVQEHHASRLHFDFRLEADGVLKSWAIPKGPSMDPSQKRLAVQVEDHPLAYADFEGTIPEGQYGAGTVSIWDRGTYDNLLADKPVRQTLAEGIDAGRLEFGLHGKKLQGRFAMIRMAGKRRTRDQWLLIKMKDEAARPEPTSRATTTKPKSKTATKAPASSRQRSARQAKENVAFTHLDKIMYPEVGITKGEVIDYYRQIAPHLLPFLRHRPITLERLPEGLGNGNNPHFWQKNTPTSYPDWIDRVELATEQGKSVNYALVNDLNSLLYLVNQGTLTFHVWFSRTEDLDRPDFVLFDLDPGQAAFAEVVAVAKELHTLLQTDGHDAFVKTSGKAGLHVLVPWSEEGGYDKARSWAAEIAGQVVAAMPKNATIERSKARRGSRVYIDVMQNVKGHHVVPPYVLRAISQATVSTPLRWQEVKPELEPEQFNLRTISRRLARQKSDPMADLVKSFRRAPV